MLELTEQMREIGKLSQDELTDFLVNIKSEKDKTAAIIARGATDREFFARFFFPHYCTTEWNQFHKDRFESYVYGQRKIRRATAAPRGAAKSTMVTLIEAIHDVCYGLENFILVLSSTTPLANKKLKDIRNEILTNDLLCAVYGLRFPRKKAGESEFLLLSNAGKTYFAALGRGSEVRGIRYNQHRPTKIICDDVEFSEEVYNEKSRRKTEDWFNEDVSKCGDPTKTSIEFVGTVLHKDSLLSKLLNKPTYDSKKYKAILSWSEREDLWNQWRKIYHNIENTKRKEEAEKFFIENRTEMLKGTSVMWEQREDYYAHMVDMEEIGRRSFFKEKQNDPIGSEEPVFERIYWYREVEQGFQIEETGHIIPWSQLKLNSIAAIDPSTGKVKSTKGQLGDFTVLLVGYKDPKGRLFVHHDFTKRVSPTRYISAIFDLHDTYKFERMAVETNLYRNLLLPNIIEERKRREEKTEKDIRLAFYDVEQTENKRERITRLEPKCNNGWILFNRALSKEFMSQVEDFPHADHDDGPDCLEILWNLAHDRYAPAGVDIDPFAGR